MASDEQPTTIIGAASDLSRSLITALPPAFVMLVVLNIAFLAVVMWFLDSQMEERTAVVAKLFDRCMDIALHAPPPH